MVRKSEPEDFWRRVDRTAGDQECWPFVGHRTEEGYGRIGYQGEVFLTHRLAFRLANDSDPENLLVLHSCDNPPCCNPKHLRLGTDKENMKDRSDRSRHWRDRHPEIATRGEKNGMARLNEARVREILSAWHHNGMTIKEIANAFSEPRGTVSNIVRRVSWRHVSAEYLPPG